MKSIIYGKIFIYMYKYLKKYVDNNKNNKNNKQRREHINEPRYIYEIYKKS